MVHTNMIGMNGALPPSSLNVKSSVRDKMNIFGSNELMDKTLGWNAIILLSTILFSLIFACATPFAALAGLAALHLRRTEGLSLIVAAWFINQLIGYGLLTYPQSWDSFAWGAAIGIAGISSALIAYAVDHAMTGRETVLRGLSVFVSAFIVYELVLLAACTILPSGEEAFSFDVVMQILAINGLAFIGLLALQRLGLALGIALPRTQLQASASV